MSPLLLWPLSLCLYVGYVSLAPMPSMPLCPLCLYVGGLIIDGLAVSVVCLFEHYQIEP